MTAEKRFSGGLSGSNPGLTELGRMQVSAARGLLDPLGISEVIASPVQRAVESASLTGTWLGQGISLDPAFAEADFGSWEGMTFGEVSERDPDGLAAWLGSFDAPAGGTGESFTEVERRVGAGLDALLSSYAGRTVLLVSHVSPIKLIVGRALGAGLEALYRMELSPGSVSMVSFYPDPDGGPPQGSLRLFNALPHS